MAVMRVAICLVASFGMATAASSFPWEKDAATPDDDQSNSGDFMDKYITETGEKPAAVTPDTPSLAASIDDGASKRFLEATADSSPADTPSMASNVDGGSRFSWPSSDDATAGMWASDDASSQKKHHRAERRPEQQEVSADPAPADPSPADPSPAADPNPAGISKPATAPVEQSQVESSVSGASATNQVVDVRLSSELQQSFLQVRDVELKKLQTHGAQKSRTAPDVEEEVAKQRQFDIYIHDEFGANEAVDKKAEKEVKANKDLKP